MKSKKLIKIGLGLCMLFAFIFLAGQVKAETTTGDWTRYQNSETNNGVTNRPGPTDEEYAVQLWENNLELSSPKTPPLIVGDNLYVACEKNIYCLNKKTGEQLKVSENLYGRITMGLNPMVYADGKIFIMTNGSDSIHVEAFDVENLTRLWYSEGVAGSTYSPLSYRKINGYGYLYTGTFQGAGKIGYYFCVAAEDNSVASKQAGEIVWKNEYPNGFYWNGAYVTDDYMVFASQNSQSYFGTKPDSSLYVVNPINGYKIDEINDLNGNIKNTVSYDGGFIYVATMTGCLYRIKITESGKLASSGDGFSFVDLGGPIRTTTIIHNNRIYVGVGNTNPDNDNADGTQYVVLDGSQPLDQASIIYTVPVNGNPIGAPLLSTAEKSIDGTVYLYFACNRIPGAIYYFTDKPGQTYGVARTLFAPGEGKKEYCISPLALDTDGTLYYKNDSNYVMAVAPKLVRNIQLIPDKGSVNWLEQAFQAGVKDYQVRVSDAVTKLTMNVDKMDSDVSVEFKVNNVSQGASGIINLNPNDTVTTVQVELKRKAITDVYSFAIHRTAANNTSLSLLHYGADKDGKNLIQESISDSRTEYSVNLKDMTDPFSKSNLWIMTESSSATINVYAVENVKDDGRDLEKGQKLIIFDYNWMDNSYKYVISPIDEDENVKVRIQITASDKETVKNYYVTFIRKEVQQPVAPQPEPPKQPTNTQIQNGGNTNPSSNQSTSGEPISKPKKVSGLKSKKSKNKVTLTWKKVSGASGYQIVIAKDKKFKKSKKQINISKASTCKKQIKLTAKTKYVRVRAYVKKNGTTVYGAYSKTLKIN